MIFNVKPKTKAIRVEASTPDADAYADEHRISVVVTVPVEFPDADLKSVVDDAASWCKKMAEGLSAALWANPIGR